ncbi:MAG: RNase A-like domain-containing protein [Alphaproteobacteria bacterium]
MKTISNSLKILIATLMFFVASFAFAYSATWPAKIEQVDINAPVQGWLQTHERMGGHTIEKHVNKSDDYLKNRFKASNINEASSFLSLNLAEQVIAVGLWQNITELMDWMENPKGSDRLVIIAKDSAVVGRGLRRGDSRTYPRYGARIVLQKTKDKKSAFILTAYPTDRRKPQ